MKVGVLANDNIIHIPKSSRSKRNSQVIIKFSRFKWNKQNRTVYRHGVLPSLLFGKEPKRV